MSSLIVLEDLGITANEFLQIKQAGDLLEKHYPGHGWMVGINQGVMDIKPMSTDTGQWAYSINLTKVYSASDLDHKVLNAGGAWLETLRQRRGAVDHDSLNALPTDRRGQTLLRL